MSIDYEQATDEDLCKMHVAGDDSAFEELYKRYFQYCMGYIMKKGVLYLDAEDCVQKSFSKAVTKIKDIKEFKYFKSWIGRACWNSYLDFYRSKTRRKIESIFCTEENGYAGKSTKVNLIRPIAELTEKSLNPCERLCQDDELQIKVNVANKAFKKLDGKAREVLETCLIKENSYEETSKILNIPHGTVMSRIYYGRRKFIDIFNREMKKYKASKYK